MYEGELIINEEDLSELFSVAADLEIKGLTKQPGKFARPDYFNLEENRFRSLCLQFQTHAAKENTSQSGFT